MLTLGQLSQLRPPSTISCPLPSLLVVPVCLKSHPKQQRGGCAGESHLPPRQAQDNLHCLQLAQVLCYPNASSSDTTPPLHPLLFTQVSFALSVGHPHHRAPSHVHSNSHADRFSSFSLGLGPPLMGIIQKRTWGLLAWVTGCQKQLRLGLPAAFAWIFMRPVLPWPRWLLLYCFFCHAITASSHSLSLRSWIILSPA